MSIKSRVKAFFKNYGGSYVSQLFGLNTDGEYAQNDEQLIKKIRGWSWTCIDKNGKACAQVPLRLYTTKKTTSTKNLKTIPVERKKHDFLRLKLAERISTADELEEITDHPMIDLLRDVNPNDNAYDLKEYTFKYLDAIGVDYWWTERGVGDDIIFIWPLKSQYVNIILSEDKRRIKRYEIKDGDKTMKFPPKDIIHFKYTSMNSIHHGDSPTRAVEASIDLNHAMNAFETASFKNGGNPSMVMSVPADSPLSPDEKKRIRSEFTSMTAGVKNTGKVMIASGGATVTQYGHSPKEMSYLGGRDKTIEDICGAYGVPLAFVRTEGINRATLFGSLQYYTQYTVNPRLVQVEQKLNEQFTPNWGDDLFLLFDDAQPEDPEQRLKDIDVHLKNKYTSINEERAIAGLEPVSWGEEPVPDTNVVAVEEIDDPEKAIDVVVVKREGQTNDLPEPDYMPNIFLTNMILTFKAMEAEIIKNMRAYGKPKAIEDEASDAAFAASADDIISSVYNESKWADEIANQSAPFIRGLLTNGLVEAMELAKPDAIVNASSPAVLRALDERQGQIRSVATTVQREVRDDIAESIALGESKSETIKRVRDKFDARFKADRVVRTETIWAHNEGTEIAWAQSGVVKGVKWDTVEDDRTCPYCMEMDGKVKRLDGNWFEKGTKLTVTGDAGNPISLSFGYESIKHPPLHPNCRCQEIPIISDD